MAQRTPEAADTRVVIIGAGVGGLTTAALLAGACLRVMVLEAHVYPGGCAGTFFHKGYRFDAGATLAGGFYPGGPLDIIGTAVGIEHWPVEHSEPAMVVHLPDGQSVSRWSDDRRWQASDEAFGPEAARFWRWQETTADALWDLALRNPAWPPQTPADLADLISKGLRWLFSDPLRHANPALVQDALLPLARHLHGLPEALKLFVDAQTLIAAQTTSDHTYGLFGASALDLPRRGVAHPERGIGAIAETLAEAVRRNGGEVRYRQEVLAVTPRAGGGHAIETRRGERLEADVVIFNLPPWNVAKLLGEHAPRRLQALPEMPEVGWGAFMAYVGVDGRIIPEGFPLHHQVVLRRPFGEGNTAFLSLSPSWDTSRAPAGRRALTISTHTDFRPWWALKQSDPAAYEARRQEYLDRVLEAAERVLPGLRATASLIMPGTPVTFHRFTHRAWGWVGGFPQTSLFTAWGPRLGQNRWLVGDAIFPGQSVPAVALGGLRVAEMLLRERGLPIPRALPQAASPRRSVELGA